MIRDYWGVVDKTLYAEISALKGKVDPEVWDGMHALRQIGNIGAHMEGDVNVVVDVEPEEALLLIEMIERLIKEWYVARESRTVALAKIKEVAAAKAAQKAEGMDPKNRGAS